MQAAEALTTGLLRYFSRSRASYFVETMMQTLECHDHRKLLADYARGRLDDREAMRAEQVLASCEACAEWWSATFDVPASAAVDAAVEQAFGDFVVPQRRRQWWAVAAAAAAVLGLGALFQASRGIDNPPTTTAAKVELTDDAVIASMDFESRSMVTTNTQVVEASETIASMDFESGKLQPGPPST